MPETLKPCLCNCGYVPQLVVLSSGWWVLCPCGWRGPICDSEEDAIAAWNRRESASEEAGAAVVQTVNAITDALAMIGVSIFRHEDGWRAAIDAAVKQPGCTKGE